MGMWKREQLIVHVAEEMPICPVSVQCAMMVYVIGVSPLCELQTEKSARERAIVFGRAQDQEKDVWMDDRIWDVRNSFKI